MREAVFKVFVLGCILDLSLSGSEPLSRLLGVKLGKCNQAEMYGEHMEFESLRFHLN